jgi:hypothetical protein
MALQTSWHDSHYPTLYTVYGREWTWDDFAQHYRNIVKPMLASVTYPVALIADMRQSTWLKPDRLIHNIREERHPFAEQIHVVVFALADHTVGALLVTAFSRYHPQRRYLSAANLDNVQDLISQQMTYS